MKRFGIIAILLCMLSAKASAQEVWTGNFGMGYAVDVVGKRISYVPEFAENTYSQNIVCHNAFVLYRYRHDNGFYVEPKMSLYYMQFERHDGWSVNVGFTNYVLFDLQGFTEYGIGAECAAGYNIRLADKLNLDLFVAPDYRCALSCISCREHDLLKGFELENKNVSYPAIYERHYFLLEGGIGVNYGKVFLKSSYGKYMSDRLTLNRDADRPSVVSVSVGFKW